MKHKQLRGALEDPVVHSASVCYELIAVAHSKTLIALLRLLHGLANLLAGTFDKFLELVLMLIRIWA